VRESAIARKIIDNDIAYAPPLNGLMRSENFVNRKQQCRREEEA
jgi:hypothetical protein